MVFDKLVSDKLKEPFYPDELEWKPQSCGKKSGRFWVKALAYVTNRAIMDRLDSVVGAENWKNEYTPGPSGGVLCGLSIRIGTEWVTKWDGAENTDIEPVKGGLSGASKRSAVLWGIGRYLYDLEENFGEPSEGGIFSAKTKEGEWFNWNPPKLPEWAIPGSGAVKKRGDKPPADIVDPTEVDHGIKRLVEVKAWLNQNDAALMASGQKPRLRTMLAAAGTDVAKLDEVLASAKLAIGV